MKIQHSSNSTHELEIHLKNARAYYKICIFCTLAEFQNYDLTACNTAWNSTKQLDIANRTLYVLSIIVPSPPYLLCSLYNRPLCAIQ